jgi:hypothetical protein
MAAMRSPEQWRRIVYVSGAVGLLLMVIGLVSLPQPAGAYRTPALLAFYGGCALVLAAILIWYRYVPPRPPAPEEPEEPASDDDFD